MSNNATPERGVEPFNAYPLEARWKHIREHIARETAAGRPVRPGHVANTYGGGLINKADVRAEILKTCELGGDGK